MSGEISGYEPVPKRSVKIGTIIRTAFLTGVALIASACNLQEARQPVKAKISPEPSGATLENYTIPDYIVQRGDALTTIADRVYAGYVHRVTGQPLDVMTGAKKIADENGIQMNTVLQPGQVLKMPAPPEYAPPAREPQPTPTLAPGAQHEDGSGVAQAPKPAQPVSFRDSAVYGHSRNQLRGT